jgi:HSP20 family molecular chaperone IbpA
MEGNSTLSDLIRSNGGEHHGWQPQVDIEETQSTITVKLNVAGVDHDTLDVDFYNNLVSVKGARDRGCPDGTVYVRNEIPYGEFERKISIPLSVTLRESVKLELINGMLRIRIDKTREERNRFSMGVLQGTRPDYFPSRAGRAEVDDGAMYRQVPGSDEDGTGTAS